MSRFTKIGAKGKKLATSAKKWDAVLDSTTGLMVTVAETKSMTWKDAQTVVAKLKTAGFTDWRLPTVDELFAIADRNRYKPAIDVAFFPRCKSDWYWTSTPAALSPADCAWYVYFNDGYADWLSRDGGSFVRAVRSSQS